MKQMVATENIEKLEDLQPIEPEDIDNEIENYLQNLPQNPINYVVGLNNDGVLVKGLPSGGTEIAVIRPQQYGNATISAGGSKDYSLAYNLPSEYLNKGWKLLYAFIQTNEPLTYGVCGIFTNGTNLPPSEITSNNIINVKYTIVNASSSSLDVYYYPFIILYR